MKNQTGKPSDFSKANPPLSTKELSGPQSGSQSMTLPQPLRMEGDAQNFQQNSIEYHLTIRLTHETLSRRELSLLLEVLEYQVVKWGCSFTQYLAISELYFRLLGNKRSSKEIRESNIRKTLTVAEIIIHALKNADFSLDGRTVCCLSDRVASLLIPNLMSSRTYGSRFKTWRPEKFLVVRIVPVDIILERRKNSERYTSYCKGYGESHPSAHRERLSPSFETDGDGKSFEQSEEEFLFQRCSEPIHVLCEFLLIKYSNLTDKKL